MLEVFGLEDETKWLYIVKQFKSHDVYYLPQYVKAFQIHGDGETMLFYYQGKNTRAVNVVMKRDIAGFGHFADRLDENTLFDLYTPYGYGGFLLEGDRGDAALKELDMEYSTWCKNHGIVSEFVRFHPMLNNYLKWSLYIRLSSWGKPSAWICLLRR